MMLWDAVFIMELFLRKKEGELDRDFLFKNSTISKIIERDLILLENQIPFDLLHRLYDKVVPASRKEPCPRFDPDENDRLPIIKTATKLKGLGITFEKISNTCLLDVKFEKEEYLNWLSCFGFSQKGFKARLLIPVVRVDYSTESVLRDLMAFEQYSYPKHHYVSSYVALIGYLTHSKEDVDVMVEDKVITHDLGSDKELAQLINILCKNNVLNWAPHVMAQFQTD
ncbi:putative UPF0481 protein At3g02645 [Prosopis cineraria]|uniref:putative UPF0481 protein At3g02645 n=1 Tax=Prosopis cineraria TaxID=364024 RepID=UPI00240FDA6E|nr:putative UPF0481 protein At3g02645 [Prosopis cineraria]